MFLGRLRGVIMESFWVRLIMIFSFYLSSLIVNKALIELSFAATDNFTF